VDSSSNLAYSAPGESPPLSPEKPPGTVQDLLLDATANNRAIVSEVRRDLAETHTKVSDLHRIVVKNQGGGDDKQRSVSITRAPPITN
jgi:hypothetical protein